MRIKAHRDPETKEVFLYIKEFYPFYDINKIKFYALAGEEGILVLTFYDKNKKLLKPNKERKYRAKETKSSKKI